MEQDIQVLSELIADEVSSFRLAQNTNNPLGRTSSIKIIR